MTKNKNEGNKIANIDMQLKSQMTTTIEMLNLYVSNNKMSQKSSKENE